MDHRYGEQLNIYCWSNWPVFYQLLWSHSKLRFSSNLGTELEVFTGKRRSRRSDRLWGTLEISKFSRLPQSFRPSSYCISPLPLASMSDGSGMLSHSQYKDTTIRIYRRQMPVQNEQQTSHAKVSWGCAERPHATRIVSGLIYNAKESFDRTKERNRCSGTYDAAAEALFLAMDLSFLYGHTSFLASEYAA